MVHELTSPPSPEANMEALRSNSYPGRGIVMGFDSTGRLGIQVYWVMGRSENSRNRMLVLEEGVVKTVPFDESKVQDPSLIIYNAMRRINGFDVVSNGDQTDTIAEAVRDKKDFFRALRSRSYEPDSPNFTPRISGILAAVYGTKGATLIFSKISKDPKSDLPVHESYVVDSNELHGKGRCIHTYEGDGNPLPSFKGEPYDVLLEGSIGDIARTYWDLLNPANRVSLAVKTVDLETGEANYRIINQLGELDPSLIVRREK